MLRCYGSPNKRFPCKRLLHAHISNTKSDVIPRALQHSCAAGLLRDPPGCSLTAKNLCLVPKVPCAPRLVWAPCLRRSMKDAATRARGDAVFKSAELREYLCACGSRKRGKWRRSVGCCKRLGLCCVRTKGKRENAKKTDRNGALARNNPSHALKCQAPMAFSASRLRVKFSFPPPQV